MTRSWYSPTLYLWRVKLDREEIDHRSPVVYVVAGSSAEAAEEARQVIIEAWRDNQAPHLRALSVEALHPVHGIAAGSRGGDGRP